MPGGTSQLPGPGNSPTYETPEERQRRTSSGPTIFDWLNPSYGFNVAANGANIAAGDYRGLADDMWNRYQQASDRAMGYTNTSREAAEGMYRQNTGSQMEDWYRQYGQRFMDPSQQQTALGQFQGYMSSPTHSQFAQNQAQQYVSGPTAASGQYGAYQAGYNRPGAAEQFNNNATQTLGASSYADWYRQNAGRLGGQTNTQDVFNSTAYQLDGPGRSESMANLYGPNSLQRFASNLPGAQGPSRIEGAAPEVGGYYRGANDVSRYNDSHVNEIHNQGIGETYSRGQLPAYDRAGTGEQFYAGTQGAYRGPGMGEAFTARNLGSMEKASRFEQAIESDLTGEDASAFAKKQAVDALNQQMAARGGYNSSGAFSGLGNILGSFAATDADRRLNRIKDAESMRMGRIAQGQGMAHQGQAAAMSRLGQGQGAASDTQRLGLQRMGQGVDVARGAQSLGLQRLQLGGQLADTAARNRLAQGSALQGLAGQMDSDRLSRLDQQLRATAAGSQENLAGSDLQLRQAAQADNARLQRLMGLNSMATSADQTGLASRDQAMRAAAMGSQDSLSRFQALQGSARDAQGMELNRMNSGMGAAQGVDSGNLARALGIFGMGQGVDAAEMNRYGMLNDMSRGVDSNSLARLLGMGGMAGAAQTAENRRHNDAFGRLLAADTLQSGTFGGMFGNAANMYGSLMGNSINADANAAGLRGQGASAWNNLLMGGLGMLAGRYLPGGNGGAGSFSQPLNYSNPYSSNYANSGFIDDIGMMYMMGGQR